MIVSKKSRLSIRTLICTSFLLSALLALGSCYRMPTDEDYSVVPMTNNPDVTREGNRTCLPPGVGY